MQWLIYPKKIDSLHPGPTFFLICDPHLALRTTKKIFFKFWNYYFCTTYAPKNVAKHIGFKKSFSKFITKKIKTSILTYMFFSIPNFKSLTFFCFTVNLYLIHQEMKKIDQKWCWNIQMNMKIGEKYFVAPWKVTSILTYNDCRLNQDWWQWCLQGHNQEFFWGGCVFLKKYNFLVKKPPSLTVKLFFSKISSLTV